VRRRRKARNLGEPQRTAAARAAAFDDARALAVEITRGVPSRHFDAMSAGLVLVPGEQAYRWVGAWLMVQYAGSWAAPSWTQIVVTDQRLLCRFADGRLVSLRWCQLTGVRISLEQQHLVLNYGDHSPIAVMGIQTPVLAVAAIACPWSTAWAAAMGAVEALTARSSGDAGPVRMDRDDATNPNQPWFPTRADCG
jgi:hypothetical protein